MKIVKPNVQEITDFEGVDNFYHAVARAARICYASDKTTDDKKLVENLIKSGHYSPFEHAIITIKESYKEEQIDFYADLHNNIYNNNYTIIPDKKDYIIINGRVLIESIIKSKGTNRIINSTTELLDLTLEHFKEKEINVPTFKSFIIDTSIGCTREMNRHHDNFYICEQSTRFVNFSKDKFGNEVTFNKPYWVIDDVLKDEVYKQAYSEWYESLVSSESKYFNMLNEGVPTDIARGVLPLDTHTRAIYTATIEEWQHIIDLRLKGTTGKPHGDIMIIAGKINELL